MDIAAKFGFGRGFTNISFTSRTTESLMKRDNESSSSTVRNEIKTLRKSSKKRKYSALLILKSNQRRPVPRGERRCRQNAWSGNRPGKKLPQKIILLVCRSVCPTQAMPFDAAKIMESCSKERQKQKENQWKGGSDPCRFSRMKTNKSYEKSTVM